MPKEGLMHAIYFISEKKLVITCYCHYLLIMICQIVRGHVLLSDTYSAFYFVVQLLLILNITESP